MTAVKFLRPEFADSFPAAMDPGVLYISIPYRTCGHLCCCGCGQEVITPLRRRGGSVPTTARTCP